MYMYLCSVGVDAYAIKKSSILNMCTTFLKCNN